MADLTVLQNVCPCVEVLKCTRFDSHLWILILHFGICRLKIFVPMTLLAWSILVPVNWTNDTLEILARGDDKLTYSEIDKLSISNVPHGSPRLGIRPNYC